MSAAPDADFYPGIPASGALRFLANRNGSKLGTHDLKFTRAGGALTVDITIKYAVSVAFVTVFRYELRGHEVWQDGRFVSCECTTNNNGKTEFARAWRDAETLMVEGTRAAAYVAPAGTVLCAHWNKTQLEVPSINPQDGTLLRFATSSLGRAVVADTAGRKRGSKRFHMEGPNAIDLWYDDTGVWLALQAKAHDGSVVTYTRVG